MKAADGGSAFPWYGSKSAEAWEGMTLRDYFAAAALSGILASVDPGEWGSLAEISADCYDIADAMLKERAKP